MAKKHKMPKYHELMNLLLKALHDLGGSGSIDEIATRVSEILDLPDEVLSTLHDPQRSSRTEVEYRLAWARTYLKKYGILDNPDRGIWVIVSQKKEVTSIDTQTVVRKVREMSKAEKDSKPTVEKDEEEITEGTESWRSELFQILTYTGNVT